MMNIKKLFHCIKNRISDKGETMVETLVSVLISALALLLLSTAIGSSVNMIRMSKVKMEEIYQSESTLIASTTSDSDPEPDPEPDPDPDPDPDPEPATDPKITFSVALELDSEGNTLSAIDVTPYVSDDGGAFYEKGTVTP